MHKTNWMAWAFAIMILPAFAATREGCVAGDSSPDGTWWQDQQDIMGTVVRVELWHADRARGCAAIAAVMDEMRRIDRAMSPYIESSALSRLNADAARRPIAVDDELFSLIKTSIQWSERTHGAFDITYASVGRYYDFRAHEKPDAARIESNIDAINYRHLRLDDAAHTIEYLHEGVYIDLGGIAKGHAVDRSIGILKARGISQAMVSAGGDSRILGDRRGEPWVVGIRHPRAEGEEVAVLPLMDASVSTSGDYERFFEQDGVRYHHIINPVTGDSAREVMSVTIVGSDATTTDALSTSVFVMGIERGLNLINQMQNIDAIIVGGNGKMYLSNSLIELTGDPASN